MKAGDAFLVLAEEPKRHLWAIISDPELDPENVLVMSFTTLRPKTERACVVHPGEHEFITRDSCVAYWDVRRYRLEELLRLRNGHLQMKEPLSAALLQRVREGASKSDRILLSSWETLQQQGLVDDDL